MSELNNMLIVEDNAVDVELTKRQLLKGIDALTPETIYIASCLKDSIEVIDKSKPQLIFLDLNLPDVSPELVLSKVKEHAPDTPIIILTNVSDDNVISNLLSQGAQDYVLKSEITPELLKKTCFFALKRHSYEQMLKHKEEEIQLMANKMIKNTKMTTLGEMASNIGHEINSPLSVIYNYSEKLLMDIDNLKKQGEKTQQLEKSVHKIQLTVDRIATIIKSLKSISRDANLVENEECSLKEIINDALSICGSKLKLSRVIVNQVFKEKPDIKVNCVKVELAQVFLNLISNALDALVMSEEKWLTIDMEKDVKNGICRVSFIDSGPGISKELEGKVFEPFFTTKVKKGGTGIGLAIAKRIFKKMGGSIFIDKKSINTKFVCELKIA